MNIKPTHQPKLPSKDLEAIWMTW